MNIKSILKNAFSGDGEIAWVYFGKSTSAEIEAAYQADKLVICKRVEPSGRTYYFPLVRRNNDHSHNFGSASTYDASASDPTQVPIISGVLCDSDKWKGYNPRIALRDAVGNLAELETADKSSVVAAINELYDMMRSL